MSQCSKSQPGAILVEKDGCKQQQLLRNNAKTQNTRKHVAPSENYKKDVGGRIEHIYLE